MAEDPEGYLRKHFEQHSGMHRYRGKMADLAGNIDAIKRYIDFCRAQHVQCIFFTPPINQHNLNEWNIEYYLAYLKAMAAQTDFWSFSDYNSITTDDHQYVDYIHYHAKLVPVILARIFNDSSITRPSDFGHFITADNIEDYLTMLRQQFAAADKATDQ